PKIAGIGGVFPNPASQLINVIVESPQREDVTLVVMDVSGKTIKQKQVNVETGSNTVPVEIGNLASGSYLVKVLSRSAEGESAVSKFVKQ
ncbi:MAG: T9SS type A sorting domain-containing protein, partial [Chitinophagaceae bacterium]|nr:T9SS type A sorting domain-containing protein [Chitinophagaceae bacterium]